jgi:hypothetical protein
MKSIKVSGWTISLEYDQVWLEKGNEGCSLALAECVGETDDGTVIPDRVIERAFQFESALNASN